MRDSLMIFGATGSLTSGTTGVFADTFSLRPFDTAAKGFDPGQGGPLWAHFIITTTFTGTNTPFGVAFCVDSDAQDAIVPATSTPHGAYICPIASATAGTHIQFPIATTTRVESVAGAAASAVVAESLLGAYVRIISGPAAAAAAFSAGNAFGWVDHAPQVNATPTTVSGMAFA